MEKLLKDSDVNLIVVGYS